MAARDASAWREEILHVLADEFLTPVTVLNGVAQTLVQHPGLPPEKAAQLAISAQRASARLRRLVENIQLADDFLTGRVQADRKKWPIGEVLTKTVRRLPADSGSRVRVETEWDGEVDVDIDLATKALVCVIENALVYSSPDDAVRLVGADEGGAPAVVVVDRGPGFVSDAERDAFEPLVRGIEEDKRAYSGIGLGLFLARSVMELHGGRIDIRRPSDGHHEVALVFQIA